MRKTSPAVNDKKKVSPRGKRKLQFVVKKAKLPFDSKSIYLDIKDLRQSRKVETDLKKLGAVVEKFFSQDINYVITCQPRSKLQRSDKFGSADSPAAVSTPSPFNCGPSPGNVDTKNKQPSTITRGKAMVNKAKFENKVSSIVENAEKWGVKIISLETALKWIPKELLKIPQVKPNTKTQQSDSKILSKVKRLKSPFLKFDASSQQYKPIYKQLDSWPHANVETPKGTCPFDGITVGRGEQSREERGDRIGMVQLDVESPVADGNDDIRNTGTPFQDKSVQGKNKQSDNNNSSIVGGVKIVTAGDIRRRQERKRSVERKRGYCECCQLKYEDLDKHARDDQHKAFIKDKKNYKKLDELIESGPNTAQFLQTLLIQHCTENKNKQKPSHVFDDAVRKHEVNRCSVPTAQSQNSSTKENNSSCYGRSRRQTCPEVRGKLTVQVEQSPVRKRGKSVSEEFHSSKSKVCENGSLALKEDTVKISVCKNNEMSAETRSKKHTIPRTKELDAIIGENRSPRKVSWANTLKKNDGEKNVNTLSKVSDIPLRQSPRKLKSKSISEVENLDVLDSADNHNLKLSVDNKEHLDKLFHDKMEEARIPDSPRRTRTKNIENACTPVKKNNRTKLDNTIPLENKVENIKPDNFIGKTKSPQKCEIDESDWKEASRKLGNVKSEKSSVDTETSMTRRSIFQNNDAQETSYQQKAISVNVSDFSQSPRSKRRRETEVDNLDNYNVNHSPLFKTSPIQKKRKLDQYKLASPKNDSEKVVEDIEGKQKQRSLRSFRFDETDEENLKTPDKVKNSDSVDSPRSGFSNTPGSDKRRKRWRVKKMKDDQIKSVSGNRLKRLPRLTVPANDHVDENIKNSGTGEEDKNVEYENHSQNLNINVKKSHAKPKVFSANKNLDKPTEKFDNKVMRSNTTAKIASGHKTKSSINNLPVEEQCINKLTEKSEQCKNLDIKESAAIQKKNEYIIKTSNNEEKNVQSAAICVVSDNKVVSPPLDMYSRAKLRRNRKQGNNNTIPVVSVKSVSIVPSAKSQNTNSANKSSKCFAIKRLEISDVTKVGCDGVEGVANLSKNRSVIVKQKGKKDKTKKNVHNKNKNRGEGFRKMDDKSRRKDSGIGSSKRNSSDKKDDSFSLKWQNANILESEKKPRKVKLDRSWSLISDRSARKILASEKEGDESFEGFQPEDITEVTELGTDVSFVETTEIEIDENSNHEWTIDHESQSEDFSEGVTELLPHMFSSPGKRSDSSWGEACDDYIESQMTGFSKYSFKIGPSSKSSPRHKNSSFIVTPNKRKVIECDGDGTFETTPKKRKLGKNSFEHSMKHVGLGVQKVDSEVSFNHCSPQKLNVNASPCKRTKRGIILSSSPFKIHTSTPFRISPKHKSCNSIGIAIDMTEKGNCYDDKVNSKKGIVASEIGVKRNRQKLSVGKSQVHFDIQESPIKKAKSHRRRLTK